MQFEKGSLRRQIVHTTEHARASGALLPIPTDYFFVEDRGVRFFVRVLASLSRKDEARKEQKQRERTGRKINPFLPPEKELTVADVSKTHIAVLNKFNVMEHHLLIVTREFEDQDMLLTPGDFEALRICMKEYRSLGFYNGGQEAGASQQHRHLQLVPLPLAPEGPDVPIEPLLAEASFRGPGRVPGFPFLHAFARMDRGFDSRAAYDLYNILLASVAMTTSSPGALVRQSRPYCLLMTDEWMLLVPRSREFFEDISFNSLAFAGSLFVRSEKQLERLKTAGPVNTLASVALPR
jgi:sulfate adenylyltransferase (ADP) / ATP adenylyltransferase